jgi:hypothetical protein
MGAPRRMMRLCAAVLAAAVAAPALAGGYGHYGYGIHYGYRGHGDEGLALLTGLVIGGLAGYFISEDRHRQRAYYPPPGYYPAPPPPPRATVVAPRPAPAATRAAGEFSGCVMTREYTARIEVDGQPRDAYGTKCLRANGSWELGRLKLAPEFD